MSEQTFDFDDIQIEERPAPRAGRARGPRRKPQVWPFLELNLDVPLMLTTFTLLIFGALMVYSASADFSLVNYGDPTYMFLRQLMNIGIALAAALAVSQIHYHFYRRYAVPMMALAAAALLAVLVVGEVRYGSTRALSGGSYMPGELAKVVMIVYLAVWLYSKRTELTKLTYGLGPLIGIVGVVAALIYMQPDISAAATIVAMGGILFFLAGGSVKQIALVLAGAPVVVFLLMQVSLTARARVSDYLTGFQNLTQANDHVLRAYEAFVKGGWFGVGLGQAETKLTGLPVPPTDSIFAVIGEELGLLGALFVVLLFGSVLWRGLTIARRAPDMFGSLLAAGLTLWITLEALINMGVMVGLVPFAGNALPLISYGGSSLLATMVALGILMNIARVSRTQQQQEERILDATARGRRSERGWGLSRARRASRVVR
ncbi:MAG TPA: FtsW/RodA/SpoVE family cell cycle protein [Anaerolineales bacterium]|nr:FtsW/RodA/SpoVE family cell cycle protein [Anaerolineales bacterium]